MKQFDSKAYGSEVARILALDQDGQRLIPLVAGACSSEEAREFLKTRKPADLFLHSRAPQAALGGLFLYFGCDAECHEIVQGLNSSEGDFLHAIVHRQEPDAANSTYWFRQTGKHPVFQSLSREAEEIASKYPESGFQGGVDWDPFSFIEFSERARKQPGSQVEAAALEIQRAEWQLLFDYCVRPKA